MPMIDWVRTDVEGSMTDSGAPPHEDGNSYDTVASARFLARGRVQHIAFASGHRQQSAAIATPTMALYTSRLHF